MPTSPPTILLLRGLLVPPPVGARLLVHCRFTDAPMLHFPDATPTLVVTFAAAGSPTPARAVLLAAGAVHALPVTLVGPTCVRLALPAAGCDLAADIYASGTPWDEPLALADLLGGASRRALVVSALGEHDDKWRDGPLAHVLPGGRLASYLPSGGSAALAVPWEAAEPLSAAPLAAAAELEGDGPTRAHRCLCARIGARLPPKAGELTLELTEFSLGAAVACVLVRQARGALPLRLRVPVSQAAVPPPWRRLCQNLGAQLAYSSAADATDADKGQDLAELSRLLPPDCVGLVAQALARVSDVIPASLVRLG